MRECIFAGSFDPITYGHVDIVKRGLKLFDKVYVAIGINENKKPFIDVDQRVELIKACFIDEPNVEVLSYTGLTVELCEKLNVYTLLRGVRSEKDFVYEKEIEDVNKALCDKIETVYITSSSSKKHISSSVVKELYSFGRDLSDFVPKVVCDYLNNNKNNA